MKKTQKLEKDILEIEKNNIQKEYNYRKKITKIGAIGTILISGVFFGKLGYNITDTSYQKGMTKQEIESTRYSKGIKNEDPIKIMTTHGRYIYYLTHNL